MTDVSEPLFLFGPGYSALALAQIWQGPILAAVRDEPRIEKLKQQNISGVLVDDKAGLKRACRDAHILISAPPSEAGCPAFAALHDIAPLAKSVTYFSTTGVYGDLGGGWAFEWSPVHPGSERARRRVEAETAWQQVRPDLRLVRLPGIYGPGRSALDRVRAGRAQAIVKPGQVFSRIHVDDIASGLKALILADAEGVFHLCDEEAAPPQDVTLLAASLLGKTLQPIPYEDAELSDMARSFYSECKRVTNARIKAATGWRPRYPTYREGLAAILAAGG